jgi:alpha-1,2-mannosyltransferase
VELMASGLVTVAHNSAGPKMDIIDHKVNGLLATNVDEYANCISDAILRFDEMYDLRVRAREKVMKFSQELFETQFRNNIRSLL